MIKLRILSWGDDPRLPGGPNGRGGWSDAKGAMSRGLQAAQDLEESRNRFPPRACRNAALSTS